MLAGPSGFAFFEELEDSGLQFKHETNRIGLALGLTPGLIMCIVGDQ